MPDLIICINFSESKRKHGLVIETYQGLIPHLKSKQFSGPLHNVNLFEVQSVDNYSNIELDNLKNIFKSKGNIQITKYQYVISSECLYSIAQLITNGSVFYKDRSTPMYQIENIILNKHHEGMQQVGKLKYYTDHTTVYINYEILDVNHSNDEIIPNFYIDITSTNFKSELFFDYGQSVVSSADKNIYIEGETAYRNYSFEHKIQSLIIRCNWKRTGEGLYFYCGNNIDRDIEKLICHGIVLFTNKKKRIYTIDTRNAYFSYGIDWFGIDGDIKIGEDTIAPSNLISFGSKHDWIEYNGKIALINYAFKELVKAGAKTSGRKIILPSKDILYTAKILSDININTNIGKIVDTNQVKLQIPEKLLNTLRNYQIVGVKWLITLKHNGFGGCLADDMGLGKTLQVIAYLTDKLCQNDHTLIIVPKTLLQNWKREFDKYSSNISLYIYHGNNRILHDATQKKVIITTYGTVINDIESIRKIQFDNLIVDEAQNIKNSKSKAYKAIGTIASKTKILLTGTPIENNIKEYWDLMRLVNPTKLTYNKLCNGLNEKQAIDKVRKVTKPFILRRNKKDVLCDLPDKVEQTIFCDFDEKQAELYHSMLISIRNEITRNAGRYEIKDNSIALRGLLYLQEICCHPRLIPREYNVNRCYRSAKLDLLLEMTLQLYSEKHKIVIFSRFTRMLDIIYKEFIKLHLNVFCLTGNTHKRQEVVDEFERSNDSVFLISLKAGGTGLNLVSADIAIIYDPWWNPAIEKQAEDRIYRIGQKKKVFIYKLIISNSIEEKIQQLQEEKNKLIDQVIDGLDTPQKLTMDEIIELIS